MRKMRSFPTFPNQIVGTIGSFLCSLLLRTHWDNTISVLCVLLFQHKNWNSKIHVRRPHVCYDCAMAMTVVIVSPLCIHTHSLTVVSQSVDLVVDCEWNREHCTFTTRAISRIQSVNKETCASKTNSHIQYIYIPQLLRFTDIDVAIHSRHTIVIEINCAFEDRE